MSEDKKITEYTDDELDYEANQLIRKLNDHTIKANDLAAKVKKFREEKQRRMLMPPMQEEAK